MHQAKEMPEKRGYGLFGENTAVRHADAPKERPPKKLVDANEFISNSTAHGLKMIFEKKNGIIRRCMWALFFVGAVSTLTLFLYNTYVDIFSYPFKTVSSLKLSSPLRFPTITVCNINGVDNSKLSATQSGLLNSANYGEETILLSSSNDSSVNGSSSSNSSSFYSLTSESLLSSVESSTDEFITSCVYEEQSLNCSGIFNTFRRSYLSCSTLDPNLLPLATRRTSLTLTIFINRAGYAETTERTGVKFQVHGEGDIPDMMVARHVAAPGFYTNVAMTMSEHTYLPSPYRAFGDSSCEDTDSAEFRRQMDGDPELYSGSRGNPYSLDLCVLARAGDIASRECGCSPSSGGIYEACSLTQTLSCYIPASTRALDAAMATDYCDCPQPCHAVKYQSTISSSVFPTPASVGTLQAQGLFPYNVSVIRDNYLQLNFHYDDLLVRQTKHVPQYDWNSIMGLIGGNMGFFLGASVLTLMELFDFCVCLTMAVCGRVGSKLTARTSRSSVIKVQPLTA